MNRELHPEADLVHALTDGELGPVDAERVRAHVARCAVCARELGDVVQFKLVERGLQRLRACQFRIVREK